jgi:four helix bundle protein
LVQLERSIVSVPSNIAEGAGQSTDVQFARFLTIAIASANESVSHIALIEGLNLLPGRDCAGWREELVAIRRMIYGLQGWLRTNGER